MDYSRSLEESGGTAGLLTGTIAGALAGLAASFAMNRFQGLWLTLQDSADGNESDEASEPATVRAADRLLYGVTGRSLQGKERDYAGPVMHYALGTVLGLLYGAAAEAAPAVTAGKGTAFRDGRGARAR